MSEFPSVQEAIQSDNPRHRELPPVYAPREVVNEHPELRDPKNGEIQITADAPTGSFAASIKTSNQVEALKQLSKRIRETASLDPTDRVLLNRRAVLPQGVAATADMFSIGDTCYHKKHKEECRVKDISASGMIRVKFKNGDKTWVKPENLAKL